MKTVVLRIAGIAIAMWLVGGALTARAEAVRNGNEMALAFSTATGADRDEIQKKATGTMHTWRYLKITSVTQPNPTNPSARLVTVEPSSDMQVELVTNLGLSLKLAATLQQGDCVAARGRVKSIGAGDAGLIIVDPAVLEFKDRDRPAKGRELLREVDPRAN